MLLGLLALPAATAHPVHGFLSWTRHAFRF